MNVFSFSFERERERESAGKIVYDSVNKTRGLKSEDLYIFHMVFLTFLVTSEVKSMCICTYKI